MAKIRFRDYGQYCDYVNVEAEKQELALPKEILNIPCVKEEVKRLNLTTWKYDRNGEECLGTFYWNDHEKAWKYYERSEMCDVLADKAEELDVLVAYLGDEKSWDDDFPHFTEEEEEEED